MDVHGRRVCVISSPGDRRDEDIKALAEAAVGHFDHYICKADDNRRGRGDREVPEMIAAQLISQGVSESAVEIVNDEQAAVAHALEICAEGDLLVVFGDDITRCWKQIIHVNTVQTAGSAAPSASAPVSPSSATLVDKTSEPADDSEKFELPVGQSLIRDERGVRIARNEEGDD
jgi:cyanophycin synthetase